MITFVKQSEGHAVNACVDCVLQRGETSADLEREVDIMGRMIRGGGH